MRLSVPIATLLSFAPVAFGAFKDGDNCGVTTRDFIDDVFVGDYLVAGEGGCDLNENDVRCHCHPNFDDDTSLGEWAWQCSDDPVTFGPAPGKECPETIPVPYEVEFIEAFREGTATDAENPLVCDSTKHPTGREGDEVCAYSECDNGGSRSAVCGCVDLKGYGIGIGEQWYCLHSTCDCGAGEGGKVEDGQKMEDIGGEAGEMGAKDTEEKEEDTMMKTESAAVRWMLNGCLAVIPLLFL
uniref:Uncharacterized protein n=1 Tax=Trieres chinensis TaxID=1514140 RepID=A0A7S2A189_TRICV